MDEEGKVRSKSRRQEFSGRRNWDRGKATRARNELLRLLKEYGPLSAIPELQMIYRDLLDKIDIRWRRKVRELDKEGDDEHASRPF